MLTVPNAIGLFPKPTKGLPLPPDSPRYCVGCGTVSNGTILVREQFWQRSPDSYVLAPKQKGTVGYSVTNGIEQTTSSETTIAQSLGLSASAGFAGFSASMSASLSVSSTSTQQLTVSSTTTRYDTVEIHNTTDDIQLFLKWKLIDLVTAISPSGFAPIAAIAIAQPPELLDGPFKLRELDDREVAEHALSR